MSPATLNERGGGRSRGRTSDVKEDALIGTTTSSRESKMSKPAPVTLTPASSSESRSVMPPPDGVASPTTGWVGHSPARILDSRLPTRAVPPASEHR